MNTKVDIIRAELATIAIKNGLTKAQTSATYKGMKLTDEQIKKIATDMTIAWRKEGRDTGDYERQGKMQNVQKESIENNTWKEDVQKSTELPMEIIDEVGDIFKKVNGKK